MARSLIQAGYDCTMAVGELVNTEVHISPPSLGRGVHLNPPAYTPDLKGGGLSCLDYYTMHVEV